MIRNEIGILEYRNILVELLLEIDCYCKKNNIKYFLTAGTLIGAVRHKGFIPWDDDIDISMFRKDYESFIRFFKSSKDYISLISLETNKKYNYPFAKVFDSRMILIENAPGSVEIGPYVDVFPIDNFPDKTLNSAMKLFDKIQFYKKIRDIKIIKINKTRKWYKNLFLIIGKAFFFFLTRRKIASIISKVAQKYNNKPSKYVGTIIESAYGYGGILDVNYFNETIQLEFEHHYFSAPIGYHNILSAVYGNYMKLPPADKRVSNHDFVCRFKE